MSYHYSAIPHFQELFDCDSYFTSQFGNWLYGLIQSNIFTYKFDILLVFTLRCEKVCKPSVELKQAICSPQVARFDACPTGSDNTKGHHFRNTLLQILSTHTNTISYEFIICLIISICPTYNSLSCNTTSMRRITTFRSTTDRLYDGGPIRF
jgi:hypothetical protein